jgi:hypothetical protein
MDAVLLGTGSPPPNPKRRGPSALLSLGAERVLVDAGSGVGVQLVQAGVRPYDWPRVFMPGSESGALEAAARRHYAGPLVIGTDLLSV